MSYFKDINIAKNELGYDAWGRIKAISDDSLFHGMFTYNVPVSTWYETINAVVSPTITNCTSVDGSLTIVAGATLNDDTYLRSYRNPRYEPNRGALYSTSGWITNPTGLMTREWGTFTDQAGAFFRLKSGGTLVGVVRTSTSGVPEEQEYALTLPVGLDLSKGNLFDIQYQWRGVGNYKFFVNLEEVGNTNHLGTLTKLSVFNPALPIAFNSENLGDNDAMNFGCVDVTSEGGKANGKTYGSVGVATESGSVAISGFNQPIIAIRSKPTIGGLINTRDTLALLATAYADQRSVFRIWATRDATSITPNGDNWLDFGDGHLEYIELNNGGAVDMTFDTAKADLIFTTRTQMDTPYATSALFEGRTSIYLTPGDMFIFTMHRETGAAENAGLTFEFAEEI